MKKSFISFFLLSFISINLFAQNTDLKYYSDYKNDFSGYAVAVYYGNVQDSDYKTEEELMNYLREKCDGKLTRVNKLTKRNTWLYKQALNEWEYEKGELYDIVCAETPYSNDGLLFFVIIKGKDDFLWTAYTVNIDTNFEELFADD